MNGLKAYVLAKGYVKKSLDGVGALKGSPCQIESITPSEDGSYTTIVFKWEGTSGTIYTDQLIVENGVGVKDLTIDEDGHLIVTYTDDSTSDAGDIPVKTVEVGRVETIEYDEEASITEEATSTGVKLNFKIPRGEPGGSNPIWHIV